MKITFKVTPYSSPQALAEWLQALGHTAEHLKMGLSDHQATQAETLLLGYHHPEIALQAAMQQDDAPQEAMKQWAERADELIALFKANRESATLINLDDLQKAPREAYQQLMAHWEASSDVAKVAEVPYPLALPADVSNPEKAESQHVALKLLARETLRQFSHWPELSAQLEACSLPLLDEEAPGDEAAVDENHASTPDEQFRQLQATHKQQVECQDENGLLLEQLRQVQEELEQAFTTNHLLKAQHSALSAEKATLRKQLDDQSTANRQAEKRLKDYESKQKDQQRQVKEVQQAHASLLSEKATLDKQLESLRNAAKGHADTEEENRLLLEQLHLVQEALEEHILAGQKTERTAAETAHQHQLVLQRLQDVTQQRDRHQQQAEQSKHLQDLLQRRLIKLRAVSESLSNEDRLTKTQLAQQRAGERTRILALTTQLQKKARGEGRQARKHIKRDYKLLAESGLFDKDWYLKQYPDVAKAGVDPLSHYLEAGAGEGRNPSAEFDTAWYVLTYHDVVASGLNPLVHYIRLGRQEQRTPHPNLPALPAPSAQ